MSKLLEEFLIDTGRKRMAALMRKFRENYCLILIHNRYLGCQETKFLFPIFPTVKYSAGQMLHIVRNDRFYQFFTFMLIQTTENNSPALLYDILRTVGDLEGIKHHKFSMKT